MASVITRNCSHDDLTALQALAAELSGERRAFLRQPLQQPLPAHLQGAAQGGAAVPLMLLDLGAGGALAVAPQGAALATGGRCRLITRGSGGCEGQRAVQVRWLRCDGPSLKLGLAFERCGRPGARC